MKTESGRFPAFPAILERFRRIQFLRFLVVGGINTAFSYGVFSGVLYLGAHYAVASFASIALGILFGFILQGRFVFGNTESSLIFRFVLVALLLYGAHTTLLKGADTLKLNLYAAGALLTLPMALLSFWLNRRFVFRRTQARRIETP